MMLARWLTSGLSRIWRSLFPESTYRTVFLEDLPDVPEEKVLYVLGENEHLWSAAMICPCGCKELLQMSLHPEGRPKWTFTYHPDKTATLHPSVWRKVGCRSHFFLRQGRIIWCD